MVAQQDQRPRSKSMLSFGSGRSHRSNGSIGKMDLTESPKEKSARKMTTKANPNLAMDEAQPSVEAQKTSTLESIRSIQHRDGQGNIITDPDRSNPTRPRFERPLDTIRSFEAAIDGSYRQRYSRIESSESVFAQSRRSSYYQGPPQKNTAQPRYQNDGAGYYGNRMPPSRPESYVDGYGYTPAHIHPARRFGPRTQSDPALYGNNSNTNGNGHVNGSGVYPSHGFQQSYDTVTSASGGGSNGTDQWGNSTDPSSENSSVDKVHQVMKPEPVDTYGFNGFGGLPQALQGPILEEHSQNAPAYGEPGYGHSQHNLNSGYPYQGNDIPPPPPPHMYQSNQPRSPTKLTSARRPEYSDGGSNQRPDMGEKRKSWLKRRFSKNT